MRGLLAFAIASLVSVATMGTAAAECTCRAKGQDHVIGTRLCLASPSGPRLATCDMLLNNTTWRFSDDPCVSASAVQRRLNVAAVPQTSGTYTQTASRP